MWSITESWTQNTVNKIPLDLRDQILIIKDISSMFG